MRNRNCFLAAIVICIFASGCQQDIVQRRSNKLAATITNLYYGQVLDNVAMSIKSKETLPYFATPSQATHLNNRQYTGAYSPSVDLLNTGISGKPFRGRFFFDKDGEMLQAQISNQESFQLAPVINPDKLYLLHAAFEYVTGQLVDQEAYRKLYAYLESDLYPIQYFHRIKSNWYCCTTSEKVAKSYGKYFGQYDGLYVYVPAENEKELADFTLAVLDIATLDTDYFYDVKVPGGAKPEDVKPPNQDTSSYPSNGKTPSNKEINNLGFKELLEESMKKFLLTPSSPPPQVAPPQQRRPSRTEPKPTSPPPISIST